MTNILMFLAMLVIHVGLFALDITAWITTYGWATSLTVWVAYMLTMSILFVTRAKKGNKSC